LTLFVPALPKLRENAAMLALVNITPRYQILVCHPNDALLSAIFNCTGHRNSRFRIAFLPRLRSDIDLDKIQEAHYFSARVLQGA
jgi:hypothetical protein